MSVALPVALTSQIPQALAIFLALGLGFALPFTLLSFFPEWRRFLPKPGAWMERLKQLFAFPMFATVVWLLWVVAIQAGPEGVLGALGLMVGASFVVWAFRSTRDARPPTQALFRVAGVAVFVVTLALVGSAYGAGTIGGATAVASSASGSSAGGSAIGVSADEAWSEARVAELRAEGRPVFVDFTAAWCVTCQLNKRSSIKTARAQEVFAETNTALLVADWTNRNDTIAAELARYGRAGVPLYLVFPPEGEPIVLNELLTERQVINALRRAAGSAT
jgi:thiol:disulfide interchange protein DsbD